MKPDIIIFCWFTLQIHMTSVERQLNRYIENVATFFLFSAEEFGIKYPNRRLSYQMKI